MVTAAGGKGTLHSPRGLARWTRHLTEGHAERTLLSRMKLGAGAGAPVGALLSLALTEIVAGGLSTPGEVGLALFGGVVGGGYLGAFLGLCSNPEQ